jgi:hypothetical protein
VSRINLARVVLAGLAAGVVLTLANLVYTILFAEQSAEMFTQLGVQQPGGAQISIFIAMTFIVGIALVWIYAAIRPRFGAGIRTAIITGVAAWFFGSLMTSFTFHVLEIFTAGQFLIGTIFDLIAFVLAAIAGAWLYREDAA